MEAARDAAGLHLRQATEAEGHAVRYYTRNEAAYWAGYGRENPWMASPRLRVTDRDGVILAHCSAFSKVPVRPARTKVDAPVGLYLTRKPNPARPSSARMPGPTALDQTLLAPRPASGRLHMPEAFQLTPGPRLDELPPPQAINRRAVVAAKHAAMSRRVVRNGLVADASSLAYTRGVLAQGPEATPRLRWRSAAVSDLKQKLEKERERTKELEQLLTVGEAPPARPASRPSSARVTPTESMLWSPRGGAA